MARTIEQIEAAMQSSITAVFTNPSASIYAEWKLLQTVFARAIWAFEKIMDIFKAEVEEAVTGRQPGTIDWYFERILEFQGEDDGSGNFQGDTLIVNDGAIEYETIDEDRQLIKQGSLSDESGTLIIKIAKAKEGGGYESLNASELIAFSIYLANIKFPGTKTGIISMEADRIRYDLEIIYDPLYTTATVQENIDAKLIEFTDSVGVKDTIYKSQLISKISEAVGVVSVKVNALDGWSETNPAYSAIDIVWTLESGYFNFDAASALSFTNYKTL